MHRNSRTFTLAISIMPLATLLGHAHAQIGPNPGEIPQISTQIAQPQSSTPSESESVRRAMDQVLLSAADDFTQSRAPTASSPSTATSTIARDLHTETDSLAIGHPSPRSTLIGSPNPAHASPSSHQGFAQTIIALVGVILLILGLAQVYKRLARSQGGLVSKLGAGGSAPPGIIEVIGRYPISKGMMLVLLRFDHKILLLSHASSSKGKSGRAGSMELLCELSDPEDVASILLKARSAAGESIAQSFEQTLREADDLTDAQLHDVDLGLSEVNPVRYPTHRTPPVRTITSDEGDRAELWSSGQDSRAAAGVLRRRLATMRREQQG